MDAGAILVRLGVRREVLAHFAVARDDIETAGEIGGGGQGKNANGGGSHSSSLLSAVGRNPL